MVLHRWPPSGHGMSQQPPPNRGQYVLLRCLWPRRAGGRAAAPLPRVIESHSRTARVVCACVQASLFMSLHVYGTVCVYLPLRASADHALHVWLLTARFAMFPAFEDPGAASGSWFNTTLSGPQSIWSVSAASRNSDAFGLKIRAQDAGTGRSVGQAPM